MQSSGRRGHPRRAQLPGAAALPLLLLLGLASRAVQAIEVVFVADSSITFVGDGETAGTYVVGVRGGGLPQPPAGAHRTLDMRAANGTRYRCYIPEQQGGQQGAQQDGGSSGDSGGHSVSQAAQDSLFPQQSPSELLEALSGHCYYRVEEYWTFELCYQKQLRQYHKEGSSVESEYVLGRWSGGAEAVQEGDKVQMDTSDVAGATAYVAQQYTGGDACELTGRPREAEVRFTCGAGADTLLTAVREPASCTYTLTITTPRLCKHPAFQRQPPTAALLQCHALPEEGGCAEAAGVGSCAAAGSGGEQGSCAADAGAAAVPGEAGVPAADGQPAAKQAAAAAAAAAEEEDEYADIGEEAEEEKDEYADVGEEAEEEDEYADVEEGEGAEGGAAGADDDPDDPYL